MVDEFNIMIAGVGGQGVILMSELLGNAAVTDGLQVRGSEVLGMAVRGGSVSSTIRLGN
jgi:indolepyruvate ferredoxin oxidoreductase beta subunit